MVASRSLYGGTYTQFDVTLRRMGIDVTFVDFGEEGSISGAINERTKLVYGETVGNPRADILDIESVAGIAHRARPPPGSRQHLCHSLSVPAHRARR